MPAIANQKKTKADMCPFKITYVPGFSLKFYTVCHVAQDNLILEILKRMTILSQKKEDCLPNESCTTINRF